jgi:hypothetical protein
MPVALKAIPNGNPVPVGGPCGWGFVQFYQDTVLVGVADHDPYETTFTPQVPGTFRITAVATFSTGQLQTSDAAELRVITPGEDPNHP